MVTIVTADFRLAGDVTTFDEAMFRQGISDSLLAAGVSVEPSDIMVRQVVPASVIVSVIIFVSDAVLAQAASDALAGPGMADVMSNRMVASLAPGAMRMEAITGVSVGTMSVQSPSPPPPSPPPLLAEPPLPPSSPPSPPSPPAAADLGPFVGGVLVGFFALALVVGG